MTYLQNSPQGNKIVEINKLRIDKWSNSKYDDKNYKTFLYKYAKQTEALSTINNILFQKI